MRVIAVVTFLGFLGCNLAAYSTNTNNLYNVFNTCISKTQSDINCITSVRDGLQKLSDYIQKVRDLKTNMGRVNSGFNTFGSVLKIAKYAPGIGTAINALKITIDRIRPPFNTAYGRVKAIDTKIYPWKNDVDRGVAKCDEANGYLGRVKTGCTNGRNYVNTARSCVNSMRSGTVKTALGNLLESMGGAMAPTLNSLSTALGNIGNSCAAIKRITNIVLGWPDIGFIVNAMRDMYNALKPILDFFRALQSALNQRLCIPNPLDALEDFRELEILEEIAEGAKKAVEVINPGNWGWRRRRSLSSSLSPGSMEEKRAVIRISREMANTYLTLQKRGDICFSAQDILNGIDAIFSPLINLVNKVINEVMKALPRFTLPGLPNFANILNLNFNFNLPRIDFGIDINLFNVFLRFNYGCALNVKNACSAASGSVNFNCGSTSGKRELLEFASEKREIEARSPIMVEVRTMDRKDDKHMSEEEAKAKFFSMSPEQQKKVRDMIRNRG